MKQSLDPVEPLGFKDHVIAQNHLSNQEINILSHELAVYLQDWDRANIFLRNKKVKSHLQTLQLSTNSPPLEFSAFLLSWCPYTTWRSELSCNTHSWWRHGILQIGVSSCLGPSCLTWDSLCKLSVLPDSHLGIERKKATVPVLLSRGTQGHHGAWNVPSVLAMMTRWWVSRSTNTKLASMSPRQWCRCVVKFAS